MFVEDEKDYIMRMIKQVIRALFSVILGREFSLVDLPKENKYEVSGKSMDDYMEMIDAGLINDAENSILEDVNYSDNNDIAALALFYEYISDKDDAFLEAHDYSRAEVLEGLKQVAENSGNGHLINMFIDE